MSFDQDLERRLEKKSNDVNCFNNSINNLKEMIMYFKEKKTMNQKRDIKTKKTVHNVRMTRHNFCHWRNANFFIFMDYWC